jgi:hypothetical protein
MARSEFYFAATKNGITKVLRKNWKEWREQNPDAIQIPKWYYNRWPANSLNAIDKSKT